MVGLSILAIAALAWAARRAFDLPLCPICLGVGGTWAWLLAVRILGLPIDTTMLPILLGGSVVGTAYLLEKRLPPGRSGLLWKTLSIPLGFIAVQGLLAFDWIVVAAALGALVVLSALFFRAPPAPAIASAPTTGSAAVEELKRRMKDCC